MSPSVPRLIPHDDTQTNENTKQNHDTQPNNHPSRVRPKKHPRPNIHPRLDSSLHRQASMRSPCIPRPIRQQIHPKYRIPRNRPKSQPPVLMLPPHLVSLSSLRRNRSHLRKPSLPRPLRHIALQHHKKGRNTVVQPPSTRLSVLVGDPWTGEPISVEVELLRVRVADYLGWSHFVAARGEEGAKEGGGAGEDAIYQVGVAW